MMYAVAEPTPAMHAKITPSAAKPRVCRKKPTAIKIAKNNSEVIMGNQLSVLRTISRSLPKRPKPPAKNPSCNAKKDDRHSLG